MSNPSIKAWTARKRFLFPETEQDERLLARQAISLEEEFDMTLATADQAPFAPEAPDISSADISARYLNRDLSLIEFTRRVLDEALDETQPLLERLKFVSIVSSNLDEFFMIRVSGLKEMLHYRAAADPDETATPELLAEIKRRVSEIVQTQSDCVMNELIPELTKNGIWITTFDSLSEKEKRTANEYFDECVYPLLTPQAVDPTHPFPYISGGSTNIGLRVRPKLNHRIEKRLDSPEEFFVRLKIPSDLRRLVTVAENPVKFISIEDLIMANIRRLVPEADPNGCHLFRITRDADIDLREAETQDLLHTMEENLKLRRFGDVVRLEVSDTMPDEMIEYLENSLEITEEDIYRVQGPFDLSAGMELYSLDRPDLKDVPLRVTKPAVFDGRSTFDIVREQDVLLHHPYMPYTLVTDFIKEAAEDPDVLAIKMCLYRIGAESPIAPVLIEASEKGKQVTVVIEIKARFDEANNIEWAKRFEEAGIHVVYGLLGLKTHCKTTLIIRREQGKLVRYVHLATGNYNPETSAFYTDLGILTSDEEIGQDATELFNYLTVYSHRDEFRKLLVAPICLRERMLDLIKRETRNARNGLKGRIIGKMNRLADGEIVEALYEASQAGVEIDLIVRGICTLRPQVEGLSDNIRVRSIVGRLLEHSRCYYFENAGDPEVYTGSSDWMPRNLDRRVEVLSPVEDPEIARYLSSVFLNVYLKDNVKASELRDDGFYYRVERKPGEETVDSQMSFQNAPNVVQFGVHTSTEANKG